MNDFKEISLELLNKDVLIILKVSSESYKKYGGELVGTLTSRNFGSEVNRHTIHEITAETVVSLSIYTKDGNEIEVPCQEIKFITYCL
jgi:hypothetical protein